MTSNPSLLAACLCCLVTAPALAQDVIPAAEAAPILRVTPAPLPAEAALPDGTLPGETALPAENAVPAVAPAPTPEAAPAPMPEAAPAPIPEAEPMPMPEAAPAPMPAYPTPAPGAAAVAPTAMIAPPPSYDATAEPEEAGKDECALGELCLGPVFTLGAINPLGLGLHARYGEHLGFGVDYQFIPSLSFGPASAGWGSIAGEGRWYPFGGAFFLAGGFAYQYFSASASSGSGDTRIDVSGSVGIPAFKLGLGFMGRSGFVMGIDMGVDIPLGGTSVAFDTAMGPGVANQAQVASLHKDISDAADKGINMIPVIPQLNLLRIGYLF